VTADGPAPLVTVVLPTYNRARSIALAIRTVLDQSLRDLELLVVDDGSKDDTAAVVGGLAAKDPRIRFLPQAKNAGAAAARNVALAQARGEFVAFQDSDDEWLPGRLADQVAALQAEPAAGFCYGDMVRVQPGGRRVPFPAPDLVPGQAIDPVRGDYATVGIGIAATVARRSAIEAIGPMDTRLARFEDMEFLLRMHLRFPSVHLRRPVLDYVDLGEGLSSNRAAHAQARLRLLAAYRPLVKGDRRFLANQYYQVGVNLAHDKRMAAGLAYLARCVALDPRQAGRCARALRSTVGHRLWPPQAAA
jgi:glycosyltransferase involved in cell wall biosynthesis